MKTLMTAVAMTALIAGVTTANTWDHQATDAQMNYELSQRAAANYSGAYASAKLPARIQMRRAAVH